MSTSPISSGSFNTQECDTYSYETEDDKEAPQRSSTKKLRQEDPQSCSTQLNEEAPQNNSTKTPLVQIAMQFALQFANADVATMTATIVFGSTP